MHRAWLCVSRSGIKHQGKFWKAQGAWGSIREPQERVSEVVGGLWDITLYGHGPMAHVPVLCGAMWCYVARASSITCYRKGGFPMVLFVL